jgi:ubiquitin-protein ligase
MQNSVGSSSSIINSNNNSESRNNKKDNVDSLPIVSRETVTRIIRDVKQLIKTPLSEHGIYYKHDEENIMKGYAMIVGPEDTPYFGGFYFFEFHFPSDYPHSPPKLNSCTNGDNIRFNPNLYKCGKVCVSLLNTWRGEQWTSCQTISTVLLTLCTLLNNKPLLNEPGVNELHQDFDNYQRIIEYKNIHFAVLKMIEKRKDVFSNQFDIFYENMLEHFLKNNDKMLAFLEKNATNHPTSRRVFTNLYKMDVEIDYPYLLQKYKGIYKKISRKK